MKTIHILTIQDMNYGNRLQNYAMQEVLRKEGFNVQTYGEKNSFFNYYLGKRTNGIKGTIKKIIKSVLSIIPGTRFRVARKNFAKSKKKRMFFYELNKDCFKEFNDLINYNSNLSADFFVCGSDQIWNPNFYSNQYLFMLGFCNDKNKKIAISPSIAVDNLSKSQKYEFNKYIHDFKAISCREKQGTQLIKNEFNEECTQLIDPTLMLDGNEWALIEKKPAKFQDGDYIFLYFLGSMSDERTKAINNLANEHHCLIVDVMNNDKHLSIGPREFIYLIHHSKLVITDSYHACIFSYLFEKNVRVLNREEEGLKSMNSRMISLKETLNLNDNIFISNNEICQSFQNIVVFNKQALRIERQKFIDFIKENLN